MLYAHPMERDTTQRRAILHALGESGRPLSAREILEGSRRRAPNIGIATVYRTLRDLGVEVAKVELPGKAPRYEMAGKAHHHHFLCERCGKVYELDGCLDGIKGLLPRGFRMRSHEVILHGRCSGCTRSGR